jgi:hypothetical protein
MDEILTAKEAAAFLKVCRQTLAMSDAPHFLFPGTRKRLYVKRDLLAWAQGHRPKEAMSSDKIQPSTKQLTSTFQRVYRTRL